MLCGIDRRQLLGRDIQIGGTNVRDRRIERHVKRKLVREGSSRVLGPSRQHGLECLVHGRGIKCISSLQRYFGGLRPKMVYRLPPAAKVFCWRGPASCQYDHGDDQAAFQNLITELRFHVLSAWSGIAGMTGDFKAVALLPQGALASSGRGAIKKCMNEALSSSRVAADCGTGMRRNRDSLKRVLRVREDAPPFNQRRCHAFPFATVSESLLQEFGSIWRKLDETGFKNRICRDHSWSRGIFRICGVVQQIVGARVGVKCPNKLAEEYRRPLSTLM